MKLHPPSHSPSPPQPHRPEPSDIHQALLGKINKPQPRNSILVPTSIKGRRRHSQFVPSLPLPKPRIHSQSESSFPPPISSTIHVLESFETSSGKYALSDVDSTTFFLM